MEVQNLHDVQSILALTKGGSQNNVMEVQNLHDVQSIAIKKADVQSEEVLQKCLMLEAEIDEMVFDLYELTAEERAIVRGV